MNNKEALKIVQRALKNLTSTWLDYTPEKIPFVVFDKNDFTFFNHPNPPKERPAALINNAGTATDINGVLTATLPAELCDNEIEMISCLYHECFHVYQGHNFKYDQNYVFFEVLSFYPELNPMYRALCSAEVDVLNNKDFSKQQKTKLLSEIAKRRWLILSKHSGLLDFEKTLERMEGLASFVGEKAAMDILGVAPKNIIPCYGFSRQYFTGAGYCWFFEEMYSSNEWQAKIEKGLSISGLISEMNSENIDISILNLPIKENHERQEVSKIVYDGSKIIEGLIKNNPITIKLPSQKNIDRFFDPMNMISFGDGRIIHSNSVGINLPNGSIFINQGMALENYIDQTITFSAESYAASNNTLNINTEKIQVTLSNIKELSEKYWEVLII
ncbi:MAG: hypothetical protein KKC64_09400 [Spirochaetes bacterium]|nr:hypothetical protein [Spirochaetota bacterium]